MSINRQLSGNKRSNRLVSTNRENELSKKIIPVVRFGGTVRDEPGRNSVTMNRKLF